MKLKTAQILVTLKGKPLEIADGEGGLEKATLGTILSNIVLAPHKDKKGFQPLKSYELAKKFVNQKEVDLDAADLIQLVGIVEASEGFATIVVAQVLLMLDAVKEK